MSACYSVRTGHQTHSFVVPATSHSYARARIFAPDDAVLSPERVEARYCLREGVQTLLFSPHPGVPVMSNMETFTKYAAAFEQAIRSDDWSVVAPFLAERACYTSELPTPLGGRFEGREAVLAYFKRIVDGFDRRFATREGSLLDGPREDGETLWFSSRARWTTPGRPDLEFGGDETITFHGELIVDLADRYDEDTRSIIAAYLREHGSALGIGLDDPPP